MDILIHPLDASQTNDAVFIDTQFILGDPEGGKRLYTNQHIPHAVFLDLDGILCGQVSEMTGRHPLPPIESFIKHLENLGLTVQDKIIVYDNGGGGYAARCWWMLKTLGFENVSVMRGGIDLWKRLNLPTEKGESHWNRNPTKLKDMPTSWNNGSYPLVDARTLKENIQSGNMTPIDSRNRERYMGLDAGSDFLAGRIPTAKNLPWKENLSETLDILPKDELKHKFQNVISENSVFYCGSGVTACFNILLAEYLGLGRYPLYAGSWSEWIRKYPEFIE